MSMTAQEQFGAYNQRRYSAPWGATITFNSPAGKPIYKFVGTFDGDRNNGTSGVVILECHENQIIAFGQKDNRKFSGTENDLWIVTRQTGDIEVKSYHTIMVDFEVSTEFVLVRTTPAVARKHYFTVGDGKK